jgi:hypothetical protein
MLPALAAQFLLQLVHVLTSTYFSGFWNLAEAPKLARLVSSNTHIDRTFPYRLSGFFPHHLCVTLWISKCNIP